MTVYLIDDDPFSLFLSKYLFGLESGVRQIVSFESAPEAIIHLKMAEPSAYPDVLLLDLNMPIMDGWDFLETLSGLNKKINEKCKLYILTSSLESADLSQANNYPIVSGLLQKPLTREDVSLILSRLEMNEGQEVQPGS